MRVLFGEMTPVHRFHTSVPGSHDVRPDYGQQSDLGKALSKKHIEEQGDHGQIPMDSFYFFTRDLSFEPDENHRQEMVHAAMSGPHYPIPGLLKQLDTNVRTLVGTTLSLMDPPHRSESHDLATNLRLMQQDLVSRVRDTIGSTLLEYQRRTTTP